MRRLHWSIRLAVLMGLVLGTTGCQNLPWLQETSDFTRGPAPLRTQGPGRKPGPFFFRSGGAVPDRQATKHRTHATRDQRERDQRIDRHQGGCHQRVHASADRQSDGEQVVGDGKNQNRDLRPATNRIDLEQGAQSADAATEIIKVGLSL